MDPLVNLDNYKQFKQISEKFDKEMDDILNEIDFGAMIGSPIKYTKIRNNSKKLQKALVQSALNDVDYEKKKEKGSWDKLDTKQKATLAAANKAKNKALADKSSGVQDRMSDLATTDGLKQVAKIAKSKAKIAAADVAMKAADAEESKALKLKIRNWDRDANDAQSWLKDYEKEQGEDKPQDAGSNKVEQLERRKEKIKRTIEKANNELTKLKDEKADLPSGEKREAVEQKIKEIEEDIADDEKSIKQADEDIKKAKAAEGGSDDGKPETKVKKKVPGEEEEEVTPPAEKEEPKGKEAAQKKVDKIKKKIEDVTNLIDKQSEKDPDKDLSKYTDLLGKREGELEDAKDELKKAGEKKDESNTEAFYLKMNETLDNIERGVDEIKKEIHIPTYEVNESVASKFQRLLNEKRSV
jgi:chromosome segregation ATPase